MKQRIAPKAFDLIVRYETGGRAYYDKFLKRPSWPGGASGVTLGYGYDLGYEQNLARDWQAHLSAADLTALGRTLGLTGGRAKQALSGVRHIEVPWDVAAEVFNELTLPQEIRKTLAAFPNSAEKLSANAFGALVSLVFNRGPGMNGDRRLEMRAIRSLIASDATGDALHEAISRQFLAMRRLWPNTSSDQDLYDRRTDEADLVVDHVV